MIEIIANGKHSCRVRVRTFDEAEMACKVLSWVRHCSAPNSAGNEAFLYDHFEMYLVPEREHDR